MLAGAALAALSLTAAACGGTDADTEVAASGGFEGESMLDASVLNGTVSDVNGAEVDLGTLADKDLVVWFWAPW